MSRTRWPYPADTALDRARRITWSYRAALAEVAPERAAVLDQAAAGLGETWVVPSPVTTDAELLTAAELAEALGQKRGTVYQWARRGVIPREADGHFILSKVQQALAKRRKQ